MVETKFQTSFIPKQPVTGEAEHTKSGVGVLFLISFLLLVASIAGAIGVFVWNKTVIANTEKGRKQLEDHKNAFDPTSIKVFTDLDNRIDVASTLLHSHVAASEIFPRLQANTLKTVRFNNFSYTNGGNGKIIINMSGEAQDYESMALQAQQFTKPELRDSFKGPIFSNFSKSKDTVVFTFSSGIDPYVIDYYQSRTSALRQGASTQSPTLPVSGTNR
ncbi:MAG: hypothetical protein RIQ72_168 [Candidatus Parcubacteria bacterium]|jgi:hypothetical protein